MLKLPHIVFQLVVNITANIKIKVFIHLFLFSLFQSYNTILLYFITFKIIISLLQID